MTPLDGSASASPAFSGSASSPAKKSAQGSKRWTEIPARLTSSSTRIHFDHVGGNALIPNATMLVQRREWDAGMDPDSAARRGFNPPDFDLGHKLRLVDGEHDVFGDGSVVCLPTYGHTPGHQSLRLRLDRGEVVLAADACYFCQTLRERRLPPSRRNRAEPQCRLRRCLPFAAMSGRHDNYVLPSFIPVSLALRPILPSHGG
jgi:hypothetical protein